MNTARRGFLAFLGGGAFTGSTVRVQAAATPTLILPPALVPAVDAAAVHPLLAAEPSQMHAFLRVKAGVSDEVFQDWLEGGLRMAKRRIGLPGWAGDGRDGA